MTERAYRGRVLTPRTDSEELRHWDDAIVVVGNDGTIASIGPFADRSFGGPVLDLRPCVIVPGFVDAHVHYPQTRIVGSATGELLEWLERSVFPEEARFSDETYARTVAREFVARAHAVGTTTLGVFSTSSPRATDILFEELDASGLRALAGLTLMDQHCPKALRIAPSEAIAACRGLIARWHGKDRGRLRFAVTPRFALSCSRELMEAAARLAADAELMIQTHLAENPTEDEATLRAHPFAKDYLEVYDRVGLFGERTLFAHAVHLSASAWDRIEDRGARIAHCPDSNFFLGSGRMRLDEARRRGILVALGSDVAAGRTFSIRRAMSYAYDSALCIGHPLGPEELFCMATRDGARALGVGEVTGTLEPGKDADLIAIRLPDYARDPKQILSLIVFASDATSIERMLVRGRPVSTAP